MPLQDADPTPSLGGLGVTAEDGMTKQTYYVLVNRAEAPSTDATLTDLVVNGGGADLTLTPTFASATETYTAMVAKAVTQVTVTPTLGDSGATIEYLDASDMTLTDADTLANGQQVALTEGDNVIKVKLTAADGNTTHTYTVTVNRPATTLVTIAADQPAFTAELDDVIFTLTRTGDPAAALDVAAALTQDQDLLESTNLAQTVTFGAGEATATLRLRNFFFQDHMVTEDEVTLTATVQAGSGYEPGSPNTVSTRIVVADPAITARRPPTRSARTPPTPPSPSSSAP